MIKKFIAGLMCMHASIAAAETTHTGIPLDSEWKKTIYHYAQENVKHVAWGLPHAERDYQISLALAESEGYKIDTDVIFAAAFLHDIGAIPPFRDEKVEHSLRSVELAESLLAASGFPMQKWPLVKASILGHMYYAEEPTVTEAIVFRDADALDFLGAIGVTRLVSITGHHKWSPDLFGAFNTLQQFKNDLPAKLITRAAKEIAVQRVKEFEEFQVLLNKETFSGNAL